MSKKLNSIVAVAKDRKDNAKQILTEAHKASQRRDTFDGLVRNFRPILENEICPPAESKKATNSVGKLIDDIWEPLALAMDTILTQDVGNRGAIADVVCAYGSKNLNLKDVPATHLLFLEKQLTDLHTFVAALPTLDPNVDWSPDTATGTFRGTPVKTLRTKKTQRSLVLLAPTDKHPGQAQLITEDVPAIEVETTPNSGAIPEQRKKEILERITLLREAVVQARESANSVSVVEQKEGDQILDFIFGA